MLWQTKHEEIPDMYSKFNPAETITGEMFSKMGFTLHLVLFPCMSVASLLPAYSGKGGLSIFWSDCLIFTISVAVYVCCSKCLSLFMIALFFLLFFGNGKRKAVWQTSLTGIS